MDATYKVNNLRMPLFTLAIVDKCGVVGQPVAHALLSCKDQAHIELFLKNVLSGAPSLASLTFVTVKDLTEVNAIHLVSPDANFFLCQFHTMKAFAEELKRHTVSEHDQLIMV